MSATNATNWKNSDVKKDNFDFWNVPGNYAGTFGLVFFFVSLLQVVAMIWDAQGKAAGKKSLKSTDKPHESKELDDETQRIYNAIEKFAKVSLSKNRF